MEVMPGLFEKIFTDLGVDPSQHWVRHVFPNPDLRIWVTNMNKHLNRI